MQKGVDPIQGLFGGKGSKEILRGAAVNNQTEVINYIIERGFNDLSGALYNAAENRHKDFYWYLVGKGAERQSWLESDFELDVGTQGNNLFSNNCY